MSSKVYSAAIIGLDAQIIEVETDISYGLRCFNIVGLPDKAVEESKERVGAAIKSSYLKSPHQQPHRVLVNLAPADLKKEGSLYDLPIALGYLLVSKQIKFNPQNKIVVGELSLDGKLRPIKGVLSLAMLAKKINFDEIILPKQNAKEAGLIKNIKAIGVESLKEAIDYLEGKKNISPASENFEKFLNQQNESFTNLVFIKGQEYAKRGLEIAAAGNHNLLMTGPPGTGKTLLAKALPEILPPLSLEESLEVTKIYSIAGLLPEGKSLIRKRPFRSPHHTSSEAALLGGGNPPMPGEITLSHRGILFLDEFPEFHRDVLESLRQPIEEKIITVLRAKNRLTFPANFTLVAASNPCPCGNLNNPEKICTCTTSQIQKYKRKMSGPLMDRIDVFVEVPAVKYEKLTEVDDERFVERIKKRIEIARQIQKERFKSEKGKIMTNNEMPIPQIKKYCETDEKSQSILKKYVNSGQISARGYHRVLKMARTIADLEEKEKISFDNLMEALMYRLKEEN